MSRRTWDSSTPRQWLIKRLSARLVAVPPSGPAYYAVINDVLEEVYQECDLISIAAKLSRSRKKPFLLQVQAYLDRSPDHIKSRLYEEAWKKANPRWRSRQKKNKPSAGTTRSKRP